MTSARAQHVPSPGASFSGTFLHASGSVRVFRATWHIMTQARPTADESSTVAHRLFVLGGETHREAPARCYRTFERDEANAAPRLALSVSSTSWRRSRERCSCQTTTTSSRSRTSLEGTDFHPQLGAWLQFPSIRRRKEGAARVVSESGRAWNDIPSKQHPRADAVPPSGREPAQR